MANPTSRAPRTPRSSATGKAKVDFDLDALDLEQETPEPFRFKVGDRVVELLSVADLDWQVAYTIATTRSPHLFFEAVVPEDDQEFFLAQKVTQRKLEALMTAYRDHYGLDADAAGN